MTGPVSGAGAALFSLAVSVCATAIIRGWAMKRRLYDLPGRLKIHVRPIPRLGGVGLVLGFAAGITGSRVSFSSGDLLLGAGLLLIWTAGLIDDLVSLSPWTRLCGQSAAALLVARAGCSLILSGNALVDTAATCVLLVIFINAFNFLDGSDGLAAGVAGVAAVGYGLLNYNRDPLIAISSFALAGASAGFLVFNFAPASIFMGDSGSTALGFLIAVFTVRSSLTRPSGVAWLASPLCISVVPLVDFVSVVLRRLLRGQSPLEGDRSHFYDVLLARGWTPARVAIASYAACGGATLLALIIRHS